MAPMMALPADALAELLATYSGEEVRKVLDVAVGHGLYGIAVARRNARAQVVALDWASVLAVAEENARAAGVAGRYRLLPGSALEVDLGRDYDLVLLINIMHLFEPAAGSWARCTARSGGAVGPRSSSSSPTETGFPRRYSGCSAS